MPAAWDPIDHVLALDPGGRGIARFFQPGAARRAARALLPARRVLIVTGFSVPPGLAETDGPPGAVVLGRALRLRGAVVRYVTDPGVAPIMAAALKALDEPADVEIYPEGPDAAREVLARERPTHLVAIERPGRSRSGDYLSARGESVAAWNRPLDELFLLARRLRMRSHTASTAGHLRSKPASRTPLQTVRGGLAAPVTVTVGDGGNEIGMGNVRVRLARQGRLAARIASVVRADHLVVAGVSNWGAYGIVAALGRLARRPLLHTGKDERRLVEACVGAGAVDGMTRRPEATVDALPLDAHAAVVELLRVVST